MDAYGNDPENLIEIFNDFIEVKSGLLSVTDPEHKQLLEFTVPKTIRLSVFGLIASKILHGYRF